jgi:hypothetical protein
VGPVGILVPSARHCDAHAPAKLWDSGGIYACHCCLPPVQVGMPKHVIAKWCQRGGTWLPHRTYLAKWGPSGGIPLQNGGSVVGYGRPTARTPAILYVASTVI